MSWIVFAFVVPMTAMAARGLYIKPKREGALWAGMAEALGLALEPRKAEHDVYLCGGSIPTVLQRMVGVRDGEEVRVGLLGEGRHRLTYVEMVLRRSLELGLHVSRGSWMTLLSAAAAGSRELDSVYSIRSTHPDRARALVAIPALRDALRARAGADFGAHLTDTTVRLEGRGLCLDARVLAQELDECIALARLVERAARAIGPADVEREVAEAWQPTADARGLTLEGLVMSGRCGRVHLEVQAARQEDEWSTTLVVRFDEPLGLGLALERQVGVAALGSLLGLQDIETGDAAFDAHFIVRGDRNEPARDALTATVRARLLELDERARVTLTDELLRAEASDLLRDPEQLDAAITAITQVGAELTGTAEAEGVGPYRR